MWNNNIYRGITSIGNNPTVNGEKITLETFILDFNEDIYDEEIKVYFISFLEKKKICFNRKTKRAINFDAKRAAKENILAME